MGFDDAVDSKVLGLKMAARHRRSKSASFPDMRRADEGEESPRLKLDMGKLKATAESKKKYIMPTPETRTSLKREILQLEKRLQEQFHVRQTLSRALGSTSSTSTSSYDTSESTIPKPATELIKEIAVLELEVVHLEQYLLSLYRKAFDQQVSFVSPTATTKDHRLSVTKSSSPAMTPRRLFVDDGAALDTTSTASSMSRTTTKHRQIPHSGPNLCSGISREQPSGGCGFPIIEDKNMIDSSVHRCYSTLSHRTGGYPIKTSSPTMEEDPMDKALRSCHSQPLSMMMYAQNTAANMISLAEHLGTRVADHLMETPNRISEEMVKLMSAIFSKLSDSPSSARNFSSSSPNSFSCSTDEISPPQYRSSTTWSPRSGSGRMDNTSSFEVRLDNPFNVDGIKEEFSGPYSATMVEVGCIHRDSQKWTEVEDMLQGFRSLISRLQEIDPKKMNQEEKLAFWINVHNALVMHAFLAYGIPQSNMKRVFLLLKAAYNVGGRTVSADTIQSIILGCRMSRPGQWIRMIISPKTKFKTADDRQAYSIDHPEPLLHFALCCGSHSDPALRVYTPKRVYQELESAKEEYIRATFGVRKDQKAVQLPKLVESYAKDAGLSSTVIIAEMIQQSLPDSVRKTLKKTQLGKSKKGIEWVPHNFSFRYLISKEVVKGGAAAVPGMNE